MCQALAAHGLSHSSLTYLHDNVLSTSQAAAAGIVYYMEAVFSSGADLQGEILPPIPQQFE